MPDNNQSTHPEVAVIIPVYNGEKFVEQAIQSVLIQQGVAWELIISDNASTDGTLSIIRRYEGPKVKILSSESNIGMFRNFAKLFAATGAPLVKILCADDFLLPDGLKRQVEFMHKRPGLAFSRCWAEGEEAFYRNSRHLRLELGLPEQIYPPGGLLAFATYGCLTGNLSRAIIRPGLVGNELRFEANLPNTWDYELWARLAKSFPFGLQNEELMFSRVHEGQSTFVQNRNNEATAQNNLLYKRFHDQIDPEYLPLLRLHWAVNVVGIQWQNGLSFLRRGSWAGFRRSFCSRPYTYSNFVTILLYLLTINGRIGGAFIKRRIERVVIRVSHHTSQ